MCKFCLEKGEIFKWKVKTRPQKEEYVSSSLVMSVDSILVICQEEIEIIFTGISLKKDTLHPHSFLFLEKRTSV